MTLLLLFYCKIAILIFTSEGRKVGRLLMSREKEKRKNHK